MVTDEVSKDTGVQSTLLRLLNNAIAVVDSSTGPPKPVHTTSHTNQDESPGDGDGDGDEVDGSEEEAWPGLLTPDEAARTKGCLYAAWARFLPLLHRSGLRATAANPSPDDTVPDEGLAGLLWRVEAGCRVDPTTLDRGAAVAWVSSVNALLRHLTTTPVAVPALDCLDTLRSRYLRVPDLAELQVSDGAWRRSVLLQVQLYMVRVRSLESAETPQSLQSAAKTWPPIISSLLGGTGADAAVLRSALGVLMQLEEGTLAWAGAGRPSFEVAPTGVRAAAEARRARIRTKRGRDEGVDADMADVSGESGPPGGAAHDDAAETVAATLAAVVQPLRDQLQVGSDFSIAEDDVLRWQLTRSAMREHMGIVNDLVKARKASQVIALVEQAKAAVQGAVAPEGSEEAGAAREDESGGAEGGAAEADAPATDGAGNEGDTDGRQHVDGGEEEQEEQEE
eukprot:CAMPEP_0170734946 /NCGR_PEP_ID=MMETSP0437-20130122/2849_1 /TAXON_ID=0 /ORGANISM="Sexangularia sp." /LENGTH=451 /DNA_ID=CAMNT_0011073269 /DNA_START=415 /DNA_END=1770 /DNA_ORIENTATION=+